jgi:hypothetical protein
MNSLAGIPDLFNQVEPSSLCASACAGRRLSLRSTRAADAVADAAPEIRRARHSDRTSRGNQCEKRPPSSRREVREYQQQCELRGADEQYQSKSDFTHRCVLNGKAKPT